jgi:hypothetical protein
MRKTILLAVVALPFAALAQEPARDVAYFIRHRAEATATVRVCRDNASYSRLPTCRNAERAMAMSDVQQLAELHRQGAREASNLLYDPAYWSANPMARAGELAQCRRGAPADQMMMPYCQAAAASALHDTAGR